MKENQCLKRFRLLRDVCMVCIYTIYDLFRSAEEIVNFSGFIGNIFFYHPIFEREFS